MKEKVLVIENNIEDLEKLGKILKASNYQVIATQFGTHALKVIEHSIPDIILLDNSMPDMDGIEVCKRIKGNYVTESIPIILMTPKIGMDRAPGLEAGASDYIAKPFDKLEIIKRLQTHLNIKKYADEITNLKDEIDLISEDLTKLNKSLDIKNKTLEELNQQITKQNKHILDSISYASSIVSAILPDENRMREILKDVFILFHPRDIVGGDFFWMKQMGDETYVLVADCTGHGIPGAFLSLLGTAYLNGIIASEEINGPEDILKNLGLYFRKSFENITSDKRHYDMELGMCTINITNRTLKYCGIGIPLYMVRQGELIEYGANKVSKAALNKTTENTQLIAHHTSLETGDMLYLSSDGYIDQAGGAASRKYMRKRYKELITTIAHLPIAKQKQLLIKEHEHWKGIYKQTDDICLAGIRIPEEYGEVDLF